MRAFPLKFKKSDIFAALFVILLAAAVFLPSALKKDGASAVVMLNGKEIGRLELARDAEMTVRDEYTAHIVVRDGKVYVESSDCPGGDCVRSGGISRQGQSIVCLPNRMTVYIEGSDLDAVIG